MKHRKILVPLDGSELSECALTFAKKLAKESLFGEIILLCIVEVRISIWHQMRGVDYFATKEKLMGRARDYLTNLKSKLCNEGYRVKVELIDSNMPARVISHYAQENFVDLIVMAIHGSYIVRKLKRMFGGVAYRVFDESQVPVLLIRPPEIK
ncbi:MAG: universal stress protein [Desulfobacteraceae bacterium]|nr:MAG: universal stress protein [Desulfobacteraceae bacterium]